jgi:hypothetical protein
MNANKYKLRSKLIFFMHLVISVTIIIIGNLLLVFPSTQLQHALYGLATFITVLSGLDSLLILRGDGTSCVRWPAQWRQLYGCTGRVSAASNR